MLVLDLEERLIRISDPWKAIGGNMFWAEIFLKNLLQ